MNLELIVSIIACILGIQTLVLLVLLLQKKRKSVPHRLLVLVLVFYLLSLLNLANFYLLQYFQYQNWIPFFQLELLFGFGPSLYLYTKSLTDRSYQFKSQELWHFLPVFLEFIYYRTALFREGASSLSEGAYDTSSIIFHLIQWGGLGSILIYLISSIKLLTKYRKWIKDNYSDLGKRALGWYEKPILVYTFFWFVWIALRVVDILFFEDTMRPFYFNFGFIGVALLTLWIGFKGYVVSQTDAAGFLSTPQLIPEEEANSSQLSMIAQALEQIMIAEQSYLNSDLSLRKFSESSGYPEKEISKALNTCLGINFHQFVNQYRVEAFKQNLHRKDFAHLNLLGIALESGFGSKSSFNLVFKAHTGMTPSQYIKQMKS